jgi:glutamyl-tRNA synthetase
MGITHVIRAEEHLSNTPRQIFIAQGLGYPLPEYAHLPYVAEPGSRNKLSKRKLEKYLKNADFAKVARHGGAIADAVGLETSTETFNPVIVDFYEQVGYLPDAVVNYILLLGWALDDKTEDFTREEMVKAFSLDRINKAPASFDAAKLMAFQDRYMRRLSPDARRERVRPYLEKAGVKADPALLDAVMEAAGDRIKVAGDILDFRNFFVPDGAMVIDEKAFEKRLVKADDAGRLLKGFRARLESAPDFTAAPLEALMREFIETGGGGLGRIIHAVRVAVGGKGEGFGLFDVLALLGRDRCLSRIDLALSRLASAS